MARTVKIKASVLDAFMEDEGHPGDEIMQTFENIIEDMKASPGDGTEQITLVIDNDFEPEDEDEESEDEPTDENATTKEA